MSTSRHSSVAMTLVEVIGILAVISIFAVVLLRSVLREIDTSYARQESATLKSFSDALQNTIMRNGYIPDQNNWATVVAAELGLDVAKVTQNSRGRQRVLLIDNSGWFTNATSTLPYVQGFPGTTFRPVNARFIIASSVGSADLPVSSGLLAANAFLPVWTNNSGSSPWVAVLAEDFKMERIDIAPLFVRLRLYNVDPSVGRYSIGPDPTAYPANGLPSRYYLQSTVLRLHLSTGETNATSVLVRNSSFQYKNGTWMSLGGAVLPIGGSMNIAAAVSAFLNAPANTNALNGANQQAVVVQSFMNYMKNYINWSQNSFDPTMKPGMVTIQNGMMLQVQGLFLKGNAGANYYPINNWPCQ